MSRSTSFRLFALALLATAAACTPTAPDPVAECMKRGEAYFAKIGTGPMMYDGRITAVHISDRCAANQRAW